MSSPSQKMAFSDAIEVNPRRPITRGTLAPFVPMASLPSETREVTTVRMRPVRSGGSRFTKWRHAVRTNYTRYGKRQNGIC